MNKKKLSDEGTPSSTNIEDLLADAFPQHKPEQIQLIAHLIEKNKGNYNQEFKTALGLILGQDDTDDFARFMDYLSRPHEITVKKMGRPPSKVSSEKYIQDELTRIARTYMGLMFVSMEASKFDISEKGREFWVPKSFYSDYNLPYDSYVSYNNGSSTSGTIMNTDKTDFNFGAWWGMVLTMNIVLPAVLDRVPELWNLSEHIDAKMKENYVKASFLENLAGFGRDMVEAFLVFRNKVFPNDLVRKIRIPRYSQGQIADFTLAVKELDWPSPEAVGSKMNLSVEEVMKRYNEAVRQKKPISLENTNKGAVFVMK